MVVLVVNYFCEEFVHHFVLLGFRKVVRSSGSPLGFGSPSTSEVMNIVFVAVNLQSS